MRSTLQLNTQLLFPVCTYISLKDLSSLPLQVILVAAYLVCLGLHIDLQFPARVCTNIMAIDNKNGRPYSAWTCVLLYFSLLWSGLWISLIALGSVIYSAFEDLNEHLDDVAELMNEVLDAQQVGVGAPEEV
ncbi:Aste57867_23759 [Aphanomyces stellatus]|uniref:Aste57867_23759 protein n=1 Tax=Aphanomyces stellatus TaxID=120398 RepID=A0A485LPM9_9STRA|nr:hypothetical protein As57867_023687 [Aphanomyces stellatus]VFU00404.1 Aste57867_23759 [Aphanomyces stellatus]